MIRKGRLVRILLAGYLCAFSGHTLLGAPAEVELKRAQRLSRWGVPSGDYSGIAALGDGLYAVADDKFSGFSLWRIRQDSVTGEVLQVEVVRQVALQPNNRTPLDLEGICWWPERQCLALASEQTQTIRTCDLTGKEQPWKWTFDGTAGPGEIHGNYGFESLTRDSVHGCFWTCTENVLRTDGAPIGPERRVAAEIPLFRLEDNGRYRIAARYRTEVPQARTAGRIYCFGIPEMLFLPGYGLLVLEREFFVSKNYMRSWVHHRLYQVDARALAEASGAVVRKKHLLSFRTRLNPFSYRLANYEGLCAGIRLKDGRQTVLLLSDAQHGAGNRLFRLKDYLRVLVLQTK